MRGVWACFSRRCCVSMRANAARRRSASPCRPWRGAIDAAAAAATFLDTASIFAERTSGSRAFSSSCRPSAARSYKRGLPGLLYASKRGSAPFSRRASVSRVRRLASRRRRRGGDRPLINAFSGTGTGSTTGGGGRRPRRGRVARRRRRRRFEVLGSWLHAGGGGGASTAGAGVGEAAGVTSTTPAARGAPAGRRRRPEDRVEQAAGSGSGAGDGRPSPPKTASNNAAGPPGAPEPRHGRRRRGGEGVPHGRRRRLCREGVLDLAMTALIFASRSSIGIYVIFPVVLLLGAREQWPLPVPLRRMEQNAATAHREGNSSARQAQKTQNWPGQK